MTFGTPLFSLVLVDFFDQILLVPKILLSVWYFDDGTIMGPGLTNFLGTLST